MTVCSRSSSMSVSDSKNRREDVIDGAAILGPSAGSTLRVALRPSGRVFSDQSVAGLRPARPHAAREHAGGVLARRFSAAGFSPESSGTDCRGLLASVLE